ncbi:hypothetical protein BDV97DRAFT_367656 [Delphinella strobiligena]|nr:hypothetical protein BDV97DRAFT_367656 [Delphinella strobiligena]
MLPSVCTIVSSTWFIETKPAPGKGFGVFATKDIPRGTLILLEPPICIQTKTPKELTDEDIRQSIDQLPPDQQAGFYALSDGGRPWLTPLVRKFKANAFGYECGGLPSGSSCISLKLSRFNHSCLPNAGWIIDEEREFFEVRTLGHVRRGAEITVCYATDWNTLMTSAERGCHLGLSWGFRCDCRPCKSQTFFGLCSDMRRFLLRHLDCLLNFGTIDKRFGRTAFTHPCPFMVGGQIPAVHLTEKRRTMYWFLTARLLEAEGLRDMQMARAWHGASTSLLIRFDRLSPDFTPGREVMLSAAQAVFRNVKLWQAEVVAIHKTIFSVSRRTTYTEEDLNEMSKHPDLCQLGEILSSSPKTRIFIPRPDQVNNMRQSAALL